MTAWNVYLRGVKIDTVFFNQRCDAEYVKQSLINHDGCDPDIIVRRALLNITS